MNTEIKPIETEYNGYRFRSRLEARWAVFFDTAGIPYEYEPEGFVLSDGTMYLPDFYLKDQDTFFECKGVMSSVDKHKIEMLAKDTGKEIVIGYSDLAFSVAWWMADPTEEEIRNGSDAKAGILENNKDCWLCKCRKCGKLYFIETWGSWACRCCGHYDGDSGFEVLCVGDGWNESSNLKYYPMQEAKKARFEHGETPKSKTSCLKKPLVPTIEQLRETDISLFGIGLHLYELMTKNDDRPKIEFTATLFDGMCASRGYDTGRTYKVIEDYKKYGRYYEMLYETFGPA